LKYAGREDIKVEMLARGKVLKYNKNNGQFT
jgi:tRNA U54 and U55 pseudouridine synthase Pus10